MYLDAQPGNANAGYNNDGGYAIIYPPPPSYSRRCPVNVDYDTLPEDTRMRHTILGPTSLKQLYRGPRNYPPQYMTVPADTLYGRNTNVYNASSELRTYGKAIFPYHHRSPREVLEFSEGVLPYPAIERWTHYNSVSDGAWGR
jgi:hypothetical protein